MRFLVLMLSPLLSFSAVAFADTEQYEAIGGHYGKVVLARLNADTLNVSTCGSYFNGRLCVPISAVVTKRSGDTFVSLNGSITITYGNARCAYPIGLTLVFQEDKLFISEFGPGSFPSSSSGCPSMDRLAYSNYLEPKSYTKTQL